MSWVRIDDDFATHRKVRRLSDAAFRLHVSALCWASKYLTDGHIPGEDLPYVGGDLDDQMDPSTLDRAAKELVERGVWHEGDKPCPTCPSSSSGWIIHDFLDLNPSAEQTREQRKQAADRQRRLRERRGSGEQQEGQANSGTSVDAMSRRDSRNGHAVVTRESRDPVPYPSPTPKELKELVAEGDSAASVSDAKASVNDAEDNPKPKPKSKPKRPRRVAVTDDPDFDRLWAVYPRHVSKADAQKAWAKAVPKVASPDVIIAAAERYRDWSGRNPEFTAHAATWLNGERWADELAGNRSSHVTGAWWDN